MRIIVKETKIFVSNVSKMILQQPQLPLIQSTPNTSDTYNHSFDSPLTIEHPCPLATSSHNAAHIIMSISNSTSTSDDTITSMPIDRLEQVRSSVSPPRVSTKTTPYSITHETSNTEPSANRCSIRPIERRQFQRLPIPTALFVAAAHGDSTERTNASELPVDVKIVSDPSIYQAESEEETECFSDSLGHSPISEFRFSPKSRSPRAVYAALRSGLKRGRRSRDRITPGIVSGQVLDPPHSRELRFRIRSEPQEPVVPKKKVLSRKPIPAKLFQDLDSRTEAKQRSFSVPETFSVAHLNNSSDVALEIEQGNTLGLYLSGNPKQSQQSHQDQQLSTSTYEALISPTPIGKSDNAAQKPFSESEQDSALVSPAQPQQRLRRTTRSISESHADCRRFSLVGSGCANVHSAHRTQGKPVASIGGALCELTSYSDHSNSDTGSDDSQTFSRRVRTRSGSEPVRPTSAVVEEARRLSVGQQAPILRRVSRKREGEMRSVYLARKSSLLNQSSPTSEISYMTNSPQKHLQPLLVQNLPIDTDKESIEVLKTPDPDPTTDCAFGTSSDPLYPHAFLSSSNLSHGMCSTDSTRCDIGSFGPAGKSSSETSMASLMVLQQQIQMKNFQRQFAPPVADPHPSPERVAAGKRREKRDVSEAEQKYVADVDAKRKDSRVRAEAMEEDEGRLVRQYGALRIKNWPSSGEEAEEGGGSQGTMYRGTSSEGEGGSTKLGLRHMFSNPILAVEKEVEGGMGSLRQRRAKPPISITTLPTHHQHHHSASSSSSHSSRVSADIIGAAISLRKKHSRTNILSPTTSASIHSPPPCPPPTTPLPQLPTPRSAPIVANDSAAKHGLSTKRSFVRCSSTPVSPFEATHPQVDERHAVRGTAKSQSCNLLSPMQPLTALSASTSITNSESGAEAWNDTTTADSSVLHTPPLTGGLTAPFFDKTRPSQQPKTPLSALTDISVATPVTAQPTAAVGDKFDSLLAYLSSKPRTGDIAEQSDDNIPRIACKSSSNHHGQGTIATASEGDVTQEPVVYGLAL